MGCNTPEAQKGKDDNLNNNNNNKALNGDSSIAQKRSSEIKNMSFRHNLVVELEKLIAFETKFLSLLVSGYLFKSSGPFGCYGWDSL